MIPYGRQDITQADIDAVMAVLRSDFLTQGPQVPAFEQALAERVGVAEVVAVNSATSALHIACLALGLGPGKRLWTSPNTFVASANCALYCGATVDFVDIDPATWNMSPVRLEEKLELAARSGTLPDIVVPVHFAGESCDMARIAELGRRYGFRIIEDASHAIGASYRGGAVGNCRYSDATVFSFHPVKIITTGEGGAVCTADPALAARLRRLRSHGITRDAAEMEGGSDGPWYYQQVELGFNYRMTDIQAALGVSQLERLSAYVTRRHALAEGYRAALRELPLAFQQCDPQSRSALHLFPITLSEPRRRQVFEALRARDVGVNVHYIPVHRQPYYQRLGFSAGQFPVAEQYYATAISLPLFPTMTEAMQQQVINAVSECLQ